VAGHVPDTYITRLLTKGPEPTTDLVCVPKILSINWAICYFHLPPWLSWQPASKAPKKEIFKHFLIFSTEKLLFEVVLLVSAGHWKGQKRKTIGQFSGPIKRARLLIVSCYWSKCGFACLVTVNLIQKGIGKNWKENGRDRYKFPIKSWDNCHII